MGRCAIGKTEQKKRITASSDGGKTNPFLKKSKVRDKHHYRPQARGGTDDLPNEAPKPKKRIHETYHNIFGIERPNEIITLLILHWDTQCPHIEKNEPHTNKDNKKFKTRKYAWDALFGEDADVRSAVEIIIKHFVRTGADRYLAKETLKTHLELGTITMADYRHFINMGIE